MNIQSVSLKDYSSLKVGGTAPLIEVTSLSELVEALLYARSNALRVCIIAGGTNTFFADYLEDILFIKVAQKGISFEATDDHVIITAQAGEVWDDVVKFAVEQNLWGLENLSLIPGTVGAAPVQNIGAYGSELADVFVSLEALDTKTLNLVAMTKEACHFGYRNSLFKQDPGRYIIISVSMKLSKKPVPLLNYKPLDALKEKEEVTIEEIRDLVIATRKAKLPDWKEYPNAGSFFKNPIVSIDTKLKLEKMFQDIPLHEVEEGYKVPAAWLIEHAAKMKGVRMGEVGTWPTQPLVIVNFGQADAKAINELSESIIEKVKENTGIILEKEVNFIA